jgi:hypothetical protein
MYLALVGANVALVLPDIPAVGTGVGALLVEVALVLADITLEALLRPGTRIRVAAAVWLTLSGGQLPLVGTDVLPVGLDLRVISPQIRPVFGEILAVPVDVVSQGLDFAPLIRAMMRIGHVPMYLALVGANVALVLPDIPAVGTGVGALLVEAALVFADIAL